MSELHGISTAFRRCVGELGMWSAASLFVGAARGRGGEGAVEELRAALGAEFPVLEVVASGDGPRAPGAERALAACAGLKRLLVVGVEADCLAPLLDGLAADVRVGLLLDTTFPADLGRVEASWGPRVSLLDLGDFQRLAGPRSGLLCTVYGADAFRAVVPRVWMRCHGEDVRAQFSRLIGWNVLGGLMGSYPRWLTDTDVSDFTELVEAG